MRNYFLFVCIQHQQPSKIYCHRSECTDLKKVFQISLCCMKFVYNFNSLKSINVLARIRLNNKLCPIFVVWNIERLAHLLRLLRWIHWQTVVRCAHPLIACNKNKFAISAIHLHTYTKPDVSGAKTKSNDKTFKRDLLYVCGMHRIVLLFAFKLCAENMSRHAPNAANKHIPKPRNGIMIIIVIIITWARALNATSMVLCLFE